MHFVPGILQQFHQQVPIIIALLKYNVGGEYNKISNFDLETNLTDFSWMIYSLAHDRIILEIPTYF
jgi:hypothetical protein